MLILPVAGPEASLLLATVLLASLLLAAVLLASLLLEAVLLASLLSAAVMLASLLLEAVLLEAMCSSPFSKTTTSVERKVSALFYINILTGLSLYRALLSD
jgi:hypothetical protein